MIGTKRQLLAAVAMSLAVAGCKKSGDKADVASGQVVAVVDGKEITTSELNAEMQGMNVPNNEQAREQAKNAALDVLISRTILTNVARERKLDQSPTYIMQKRRADEALLVQTLQRDIASKITPPTRADAMAFINATPDLFSQRKVYSLDQIAFAVPQGNTTLLKELEPLKTMEAVEQKLIESRVRYQRANGKLDAIQVDPNLMKRIAQLPPGEIFVLPNNGMLIANKVTKVDVVPFQGDPAIDYAMNYLQNKRVSEAADKDLKARIEKARKDVRYQPGYGPAKGAVVAAPAPKPAG
ncbi:MAG TPA: EpsD family peptidyl-prolyl cis-trans isomerase [Sphingomonas sp.]|nr:EpsD family peptidyl-prolyl cis-trans isomerase [Sphingomonas sp.]